MDRATYLKLIDPAVVLVIRKHKDYNSGGDDLHGYFPFGDKSYVQMLHTKARRLVSLAQQDSTPNFESVQDTVLDLINYAVFYLEYMEANHAKPV